MENDLTSFLDDIQKKHSKDIEKINEMQEILDLINPKKDTVTCYTYKITSDL